MYTLSIYVETAIGLALDPALWIFAIVVAILCRNYWWAASWALAAVGSALVEVGGAVYVNDGISSPFLIPAAFLAGLAWGGVATGITRTLRPIFSPPR